VEDGAGLAAADRITEPKSRRNRVGISASFQVVDALGTLDGILLVVLDLGRGGLAPRRATTDGILNSLKSQAQICLDLVIFI
jgi:hypothetical protein